ncbi:TPA: TIR domain-containing anti-phage reverse transcriptase [Citrobacter freundii]
MSLHIKILLNNLTSTNHADLLPNLPQVEPQPNLSPSKTEWDNKKLSNRSLLTDDERNKILSGIENSKIIISSPTDVANLLEVPTGQLLYILYERKNNYRRFIVKKKNGKNRIINSPYSGLAILQQRLKLILDYFYRPKKSAHGFIKDKSIISNAEKHIKKKYVVNLDLEDYFGTVTFPRIYGIFKSRPFNFSHPAATVLAQLCTHEGKLPQGACTSPVLANLVSASLDKQLTQLAKRKNITYTRYADDITFSFKQNGINEVIKLSEDEKYEIGDQLISIIEKNGFKINQDKFRVQKRNNKQVVTGLTVNDKVNINKKYIRLTRSMIHKWSQDKTTAALMYTATHGIKTRDNDHAISIFRNHIYGRLSFIRMIRGKNFSTYLKLMSRMSHSDPKKTNEGRRAMSETETYDIFICHASEDKDLIAIPLYKALCDRDIPTFIDHVEIAWGDSLIDKINNALAKAKYVVAILSENSVEKKWPKKELNSVLAREISNGKVKLLTLVKKEDEEAIADKIPLTHDKRYMVYDDNADFIADEVRKMLDNQASNNQ